MEMKNGMQSRKKITDAACDVFCLQETKKDTCDLAFLRNICLPDFDRFEFVPSIGASGGLITAWKSRNFSGGLCFSNQYGISISLSSTISDDNWIVTNLYGPCTPEGKKNFTDWFKQIQMPTNIDWIVVGDFNLMRKPQDRNREGGDLNEMFMFNDAISALALNEIVLQGRKYTWSNMQLSPLLQKIDWIFTSNAWTLKYPDTSATILEDTFRSLSMPSDHLHKYTQTKSFQNGELLD
jgi:exonuclease III